MPKILCPARECLHNYAGKICGVNEDTIIDMHWVETNGRRVIGCLDYTPLSAEEYKLLTGRERG